MVGLGGRMVIDTAAADAQTALAAAAAASARAAQEQKEREAAAAARGSGGSGKKGGKRGGKKRKGKGGKGKKKGGAESSSSSKGAAAAADAPALPSTPLALGPSEFNLQAYAAESVSNATAATVGASQREGGGELGREGALVLPSAPALTLSRDELHALLQATEVLYCTGSHPRPHSRWGEARAYLSKQSPCCLNLLSTFPRGVAGGGGEGGGGG